MFVRILMVLLLMGPILGQAEIIKFSKLKKENKIFQVKRDLFLPEITARSGPDSRQRVQGIPGPEKPEEERKQVKEEVRQAVYFEGYIEKNNRFIALVSVNGDFFTVGEGDMIMDKIKILKITKDRMVCEVESQLVEIPIKGDDDE